MKTVCLFVLLVCVVLADNGNGNGNGNYAPMMGAKSCRRSVDYKAIPAGNPVDLRWTSTAACRYGGKSGSETIVSGDINVVDRPDLSLAIFQAKASNNFTDVTESFSAFRLVLERVIEYADRDGVPGYQPDSNGDGPCGNGITFLGLVAWSPFTITTHSDASGNNLYTATSVSLNPTYFNLSVSFTTTTMTNGRNVIDPNSMKFDFNINNYQYKNASCATGLAFRIFIISRSLVRQKTASDTVTTDIDTTNQNVVTVPDSNGNNVGTFFIFDKNITDEKGLPRVLHNELSHTAPDVPALDLPNGWTYNIIWFSTDSQVTSMAWDPYMLTSDNNVANSAVAVAGSFVFALCVVFIALL